MHNTRSNWAWIDRVSAGREEGIGPVPPPYNEAGAEMWAALSESELVGPVMVMVALGAFLLGVAIVPALDRLDGRTCLTAQQLEKLK